MQNKETRHVLLRVLFVQLQLSFSHLNAFIHKSVLPTDMLKKNKKYNYYKDNNCYEENVFSMHICIFLIFCYVT